ncbi:peptidase C2 [Siculibacillus lacustris]|uniref:Peptidase C2 n=1 Tax=Siculibacillus lacustris TaxID=1549641 RepID=A0A4Q9VEJ1_9HYPH|nr:C2 family cysteine protease [Siculibacillus lacustris]TBW32227.1 peptidase C2 [Siculibacillus lacustris]
MSLALKVSERSKSTRTATQDYWSKDDGWTDSNGASDVAFGLDAWGNFAAQAPRDAGPSPSVFGLSAATAATATTTTATTAATTTIAPAAATTSTTSTIPPWVATLKTASIATDMRAAISNGTVTFSGLTKVFTDLAATLTSSGTKLTATQLADLKTIVANLGTGVQTSIYLTSIAKSLVTGSASNLTWTGGAATSTIVGNLYAGSTTGTQFTELVGKWFLGTDLPSSKVTMGSTTFTVSYSTVSKPLFASTGASMSDVNQGNLGDCYLLASLAEVAKQNQNLITSMFNDNGNGTYGVRFYVNGTATWVTVNSSLAKGGTLFNSGADLWASLAEKGYAQLQASSVVTGNWINAGNSWTTIGNGGYVEYALAEITGASQITDFCAAGKSWTCNVYNSNLARTGSSGGLSTASVLSLLVDDLAKGYDLVLTSLTNARDSAGRATLIANHAMSIYGYDTATNMLEIRNPWGTAAGQTWATTFEVGLSTLLTAGDIITVDNTAKVTLTAATGSTATAVKAVESETSGTSSLVDTTITAAATSFVQALATATADTGATSVSIGQLSSTAATSLATPLS